MEDVSVESEITATVWKMNVAVGDKVSKDDELLILESMKMEIPVLAPVSGQIVKVMVAEGEAVGEGNPLVTISENAK